MKFSSYKSNALDNRVLFQQKYIKKKDLFPYVFWGVD